MRPASATTPNSGSPNRTTEVFPDSARVDWWINIAAQPPRLGIARAGAIHNLMPLPTIVSREYAIMPAMPRSTQSRESRLKGGGIRNLTSSPMHIIATPPTRNGALARQTKAEAGLDCDPFLTRHASDPNSPTPAR